jgi:upstream activation factor subunit UAF30
MNKAATTSSTKTRSTKTRSRTQPVAEPEPVVEQVTEPTTEVTVETETVTEQVVETETVVVTEESIKQRLDRIIKARQDHILELKREIQELRKLQRDHEHALKDASKRSKKKKVQRDPTNPRKPSGFASAVLVSDELYDFLGQFGVKRGDPIARTDVTRHITSYIKQHDLQNPEYRREILPDAALSKLFGPAIELKDPNDPNSVKVYSYMRLQKYLSSHFPKKQK